MSEKREVDVKYGDRQFKFVRIERVYELEDGERKLIRDGGNYILQLAGHTAGSWEAYTTDQSSFNTLQYQKKFLKDNNYKTEDGGSAADRLSNSTSTRPGPRPTPPRAPAPAPAPGETGPALNLTPEQQAAYDLLNREGILDKIIDQKVEERLAGLKKENDDLKQRVTALEKGAPDTGQTQNKPPVTFGYKAGQRVAVEKDGSYVQGYELEENPDGTFNVVLKEGTIEKERQNSVTKEQLDQWQWGSMTPEEKQKALEEAKKKSPEANIPDKVIEKGKDIQINSGGNTIKAKAASEPYQKEGEWYVTADDGNEYKLSEVEPVDGSTPPPPPAEAAAQNSDKKIQLKSNWVSKRWNQARGIPSSVDEIYEIPDTGRRYYIDEETQERVYLDRTRANKIGKALAIGAAAIGLIWAAHEIEEIEHGPTRGATTTIIKKVTKLETGTTTVKSPEASDKDSDSNAASAGIENTHGITSAAGNAGVKGRSDRDEQLSGNPVYTDNHNGGNGLWLGLQPNMNVRRNLDGTHQLTLPNGKKFLVTFDSQGKLSSDSKAKIRDENYEIGQAPVKFDSHNRGTVKGRSYSVIGDREK